MNYYQLTLGSMNIDQQSVIESVKQLNGDAIQTSNGLFLAMEGSEADLKTGLASIDGSGLIQISKITDKTAPDLTPDMRSLMEKHV